MTSFAKNFAELHYNVYDSVIHFTLILKYQLFFLFLTYFSLKSSFSFCVSKLLIHIYIGLTYGICEKMSSILILVGLLNVKSWNT